jgi:hypothetical protein
VRYGLVAAGVVILALVVAVPLYLSYQFSVVESELEIFNGEMYWGTNGEGRWDVHFPTQSTNWTIEIDIMSPEDSFDFIVAYGLFSWDEYQSRSEDDSSVIYLERINVSEITETISMNLRPHQIEIRILHRSHGSGLTLIGHIVARCFAPRWARWNAQ